MIQLEEHFPEKSDLDQLKTWQEIINSKESYSGKIAEAISTWKNPRFRKSPTLNRIREILIRMAHGAQRCHYCHDSASNQVEHMKPKNIFPEETWDWHNFLYVCDKCNGPKSDRFAIFESSTGNFIDYWPSRERIKPEDRKPPAMGEAVLVNPRKENPLDYLELDLLGTFLFIEKGTDGTREFQRARYTIEILGLNRREYLPRARKNACDNYKNWLLNYKSRKLAGALPDELARLRQSLELKDHPAVWQEMKRQHLWIPELRELFESVPEALTWFPEYPSK